MWNLPSGAITLNGRSIHVHTSHTVYIGTKYQQKSQITVSAQFVQKGRYCQLRHPGESSGKWYPIASQLQGAAKKVDP